MEKTNKIEEFTITAFTENKAGLISRVVSVFTRRHVNIESLTTSNSSMEGIHRFTIVVNCEEQMASKLVSQVEKQIDVLKAFYDRNHEIVYQEIALYKVPAKAFTGSDYLERTIRAHNARILEIESKFIVIEKTGHPDETDALLNELKEIGIFEFVRSGRVAIVKPMERLNQHLNTLKENYIIQ